MLKINQKENDMQNDVSKELIAENSTEATLRRVFASIDDPNRTEEFANAFTPNGQFRLGHAPPQTGRERITEDIRSGNTVIRMHHDLHRVLPDSNVAYVDATVTYTWLNDGHSLRFPALIRVRFANGLIEDMQVMMDRSPSHPFHDFPEVLDF